MEKSLLFLNLIRVNVGISIKTVVFRKVFASGNIITFEPII
jgi:hypothetical protein